MKEFGSSNELKRQTLDFIRHFLPEMQNLEPVPQPELSRTPRHWYWPLILAICLVGWIIVLCFVSDPRPMSAPRQLVETVRSLSGFSEPVARAMASVSLRALSFTLLGMLTSAALNRFSARVALSFGLILAPILAVLSQWINYGYFPVSYQLKVSIFSAVIGTLLGFALRRGRFAPGFLVAIVGVVAALFIWGTRINVTHDLDVAVNHIVDYVFGT